ncbi:head-tail connector protein [uncultured Oscillibacter sp.]|uniref:head-tail connector protein n=1 Tax=uncultured Oscillibacter sp. TaxID=876091 RepID=UPI0025DBCEB3|nr:head-tail connector protein [uncultured Oscillibacter sp.]
MAELTPERKAELLAYCRIDALEDDALLLPGYYSASVGYMAGAGVSVPQEGTDRRALYDLCINYLVLDKYERRSATITGTIVAENPEFVRIKNQLKFTEPVPNLGTSG